MPKSKTVYYSPKTRFKGYCTGLDRNDRHLVAHLYATRKGPMDPIAPYCARGWNRSDGQGFSIFRGNVGAAGVCRTCQRRVNAGLPPVKSTDRKTRWI